MGLVMYYGYGRRGQFMRVTVFGETNRTKHFILNRALSAGYSVNVIENGNKKHPKRKNLKVFSGRPQDVKSINRATKNTDAVLCLLQDAMSDKSEAFIYNLVSVMEGKSIRRLVIYSCTQEQNAGASMETSRLVALFKFKKSPSHSDIKEILKKSNIDWTIVGHPPLTRTLSSDIAKSQDYPESFGADLAKRLVSQITDSSSIRETLLLSV